MVFVFYQQQNQNPIVAIVVVAADVMNFSKLQCDKVSKGAKIRNRFNQVPHLNQDTNGKVTNSQLDITNESQEVSPFPAGDHKAHINRRAQRHSKHKTEQKHKRSSKEVPPRKIRNKKNNFQLRTLGTHLEQDLPSPTSASCIILTSLAPSPIAAVTG